MARIKHRPPWPPRELCSSWTNYLLGIVSPYLLMEAQFGMDRTEKVEKYLQRVEAYHEALTMQRIHSRKMTREEWKARQSATRRRARMQRLYETEAKRIEKAAAAMARAAMEKAKEATNGRR